MDVSGLTDEQRRLVEENLGLVAVHLRRNIPNLAQPRRDREWEDLFQEGCLGLIDAARRFDPERGIAFAAFAMIRIHHAVSKGLRTQFTTVSIPVHLAMQQQLTPAATEGSTVRTVPRVAPDGGGRGGRIDRLPRVHQFAEGSDAQYPAVVRLPDGGEREVEGETVGDRLREKFERAAAWAGEIVSRQAAARDDRGMLVQLLLRERVMVPHEEDRRALRQIARETNSSYSRVAGCEKRLQEAIRARLDADPEYHELRRWARSVAAGTSLVVDAEIENALSRATAEGIARHYRDGSAARRGELLLRLVEEDPAAVDELIHERVKNLDPAQREALHGEHAPEQRHPGRRKGRSAGRRHRPDGGEATPASASRRARDPSDAGAKGDRTNGRRRISRSGSE